jgi:hypothetical protein
MRKLLALCTGIAFVGVHSSYAQYPDAESLLGRLGVKIDKDGKPVADGFPPALLAAWCELKCSDGNEIKGDSYLAKDGFGKKEILLGKEKWTGPGLLWPQKDEMVLKEGRWSDFVVCRFDSLPREFTDRLGVCVNRLKMAEVVPFFMSGEFLKGVFGEDLFRALFEKARDKEEKIYTSLFRQIELPTYCSLAEKYENWSRNSCFLQDLQEEEVGKDFQDVQEHYESCLNERNELRDEIQSARMECVECMRKEKRFDPLWYALAEFNVSDYYFMDRDKFRQARGVFFEKLGNILGSEADQHPLWDHFSRLYELLDKFEEQKVKLNDARQVCEKCEKLRDCMQQHKEAQRLLKKMFAEYRERFADAKYRCLCHQLYRYGGCPVSKEPVTFMLQIMQNHYEDNGARRFRTEKST